MKLLSNTHCPHGNIDNADQRCHECVSNEPIYIPIPPLNESCPHNWGSDEVDWEIDRIKNKE